MLVFLCHNGFQRAKEKRPAVRGPPDRFNLIFRSAVAAMMPAAAMTDDRFHEETNDPRYADRCCFTKKLGDHYQGARLLGSAMVS